MERGGECRGWRFRWFVDCSFYALLRSFFPEWKPNNNCNSLSLLFLDTICFIVSDHHSRGESFASLTMALLLGLDIGRQQIMQQ